MKRSVIILTIALILLSSCSHKSTIHSNRRNYTSMERAKIKNKEIKKNRRKDHINKEMDYIIMLALFFGLVIMIDQSSNP